MQMTYHTHRVLRSYGFHYAYIYNHIFSENVRLMCVIFNTGGHLDVIYGKHVPCIYKKVDMFPILYGTLQMPSQFDRRDCDMHRRRNKIAMY